MVAEQSREKNEDSVLEEQRRLTRELLEIERQRDIEDARKAAGAIRHRRCGSFTE